MSRRLLAIVATVVAFTAAPFARQTAPSTITASIERIDVTGDGLEVVATGKQLAKFDGNPDETSPAWTRRLQ